MIPGRPYLPDICPTGINPLRKPGRTACFGRLIRTIMFARPDICPDLRGDHGFRFRRYQTLIVYDIDSAIPRAGEIAISSEPFNKVFKL